MEVIMTINNNLPPACVDCMWYHKRLLRKAVCLNAFIDTLYNPVTGCSGKSRYRTCIFERTLSKFITRCGPKGINFEPKKEK